MPDVKLKTGDKVHAEIVHEEWAVFKVTKLGGEDTYKLEFEKIEHRDSGHVG